MLDWKPAVETLRKAMLWMLLGQVLLGGSLAAHVAATFMEVRELKETVRLLKSGHDNVTRAHDRTIECIHAQTKDIAGLSAQVSKLEVLAVEDALAIRELKMRVQTIHDIQGQMLKLERQAEDASK